LRPFVNYNREPTIAKPVSQLVTASQILSPAFAEICNRLKHPVILHRKLWEWVYIVQALEQARVLRKGSRGLGFGVGKERMVSYFAAKGCEITATDMFPDNANAAGWVSTDQYAASIDELNSFGLCDDATFQSAVRFRHVDMNHIPDDLIGYDFLWSSCAFEHLGGLKHGIDFVLRSLDCLKPGGVAVHTTEFNVSSNEKTIDTGGTVIYREKDIFELAEVLLKHGHQIEFNLSRGYDEKDRLVSSDRLNTGSQLKILEIRFVMTSLGLIITKRK